MKLKRIFKRMEQEAPVKNTAQGMNLQAIVEIKL